MKWAATVLRAAVLALGALVLAVAAGGVVLERSGWLEQRVRTELEARLGRPVDLRAVRLHWLDAALEIDGLSLGAAGSELERVRVVFRGDGRGLHPVLVEVLGGRLVLGPALEERLAHLPAALPPPGAPAAGQAPGGRAAPPALVVRGLALEVDHAGWGRIPLGTLQVVYAAGEDGRGRVRGRILPAIAESAAGRAGSAEVFVSGAEIAPGELELSLSSAGIPVSLALLPQVPALEPLRSSALRGSLALEGRGYLALHAPGRVRGELRARLSRGELHLVGSSTPVRDVALDLDARCAPGPDETATDPGAWRVSLHAQALWRGARLDAWGVLGTHAGDGLRARAWAHVRDAQLDEESFRCLGASKPLGLTLAALEPRGRCEILLAAEWPEVGPVRFASEVECDGRAGLTYHGWPNRLGRRQGFPHPMEGLVGRLVVLVDPARTFPLHVAIVEARGSHSVELPQQRIAWASGQIRSRREPDNPLPLSEIHLRLAGQGLAVDGDTLPAGLTGLDGTDWIWPTFAPQGGEVAFEAFLSHTLDAPHLGARFDIDLDDVGLTWAGLPVPASGLGGRLSLRFDPQLAWGAAFRVEGRTLTSDRLSLAGRFQQPMLQQGAQPQARSSAIEELTLEIDNVALRGLDRQVVVQVVPVLGVALDQVAPAGKVDVRVRRSRWLGAREGYFSAEVLPREVQFAPQAFRVPTRNVSGRVLVEGGQLLGAPARTPTRVHLAPLVGEWPGNVIVACSAALGDPGETGRLRLHAAGIDPLNRAVVGALQAAFAAPGSGYSGLDLTPLSVDGRVDVDGVLTLPPAQGGQGQGLFRVHLRDNDLRIATPAGAGAAGRFGLERLRGVLVQHEGRLRGESVQARLGRTPITLREARFELVDGGLRFEAQPSARDLPLDREHLRFFLGDDTVEALVGELGLEGHLDIDDAVLVLTGSLERPGGVSFAGRVRPRGMRVGLGLPLEVESASVVVESLVFEGRSVRAWAAVQELDGSLAGRRLDSTRLQLTLVEPRLSIFGLDGGLEGGHLSDLGEDALRVGPAFSIDLEPPFRFDLGLRLSDVRVEGLLRGLFDSEFASRGVLSGEVRLSGSLEQVRAIRGDGALRLRDSTLWSIPVMQALFSQLGFDDTAVFESMRTRFQVRDGALHMSGMQVYSPLLQLVGQGTLDLEGRLHHDLEVRYSLVDRLGPLTRLVYWVQNNLLRVAVRGDMSRPRVELKGMLSVFQRRPPSGRDLPLPGLAPLPLRF